VNRQDKENIVKELKGNFDKNNSFYLVNFVNMSVPQSVELRRTLREHAYSFKVIKNRIALRALKEEFPEELKNYFQGPTAIAFTSDEPVGLARIIKDFSTRNKVLKVKAGLIDGKFVSEDRFDEIANLGSRKELIAKIGYLMASPLVKIFRMWQAPLNNLSVLLNQLKTKK
jgi:large subunit ribosomal protein L10